MIIQNSQTSRKDYQTIQYIRNITNYFNSKDEDSDSLKISQSQGDSLNIYATNTTHNKKKRRIDPVYVSPYRQQSLSIKNIMKSKGKEYNNLASFTKTTTHQNEKRSQKSEKKQSKINRTPPKYRYIPSLIETLQKNETDRIKTEARLIFQKREKERMGINIQEKNQKWADFLLRQRRWEESKQQKMMNERQRLISRERQNINSFTPRPGPRLNVQENIKSVKRKKMKLQQQLKEVSLNYFTPNRSPLKRIEPRSQSRNLIEVQSKRELQFLVNK